MVGLAPLGSGDLSQRFQAALGAAIERSALEQLVREGAQLGRARLGWVVRIRRGALVVVGGVTGALGEPQLVEELVPPRAEHRVRELRHGNG